MNGEIEYTSNAGLQKNLVKVSSCKTSLQTIGSNSTLPEVHPLSNKITRINEVTGSDYDNSVDSLTVSEINTSLVGAFGSNLQETEIPALSLNASSLMASPASCQSSQALVPFTEFNDNLLHSNQLLTTGLCNSTEVNNNHYLSMVTSSSENIETKAHSSSSELIDFSKLASNHLEGQVQFSEPEFRNKVMKSCIQSSSCIDHLMDPSISRSANITCDYRFGRMGPDSTSSSETNARIQLRNDTNNLTSITSDSADINSEYTSASNLWVHPSCEQNFTFPNDPMTSLISGSVHDQTTYANEINNNGANLASILSSAGAAKRPITGAHQISRFPTGGKSSMWNSAPRSTSNSTLGYMVCNSWGNTGSKSGPSTKLGAGPCGDSNIISISSTNGTDSNPASWLQTTSQQTFPKSVTQPITNILGSVSFSNGNSNGIYSGRSSICSTNAQVGTANVDVSGTNRIVSELGLSNIYSMFPKRPQHRMMAHWQQQQQHHSNSQQQTQFGKNFMNLSPNNIQMNGNRVGSTAISSSNATGCGDNLTNVTGNFNGGCSVLQSLSATAPASTANTVAIGSSGDSCANNSTFGLPTSDSSLDNFKFGIDQQLMEVIKSFEISNIGGTSPSIAPSNTINNVANIGGLEDLSISSPFNDLDQQIPLNSGGQIPVLGPSGTLNNSMVSGVPGSNNHSSTISNLSGYSGSSVLGNVGINNPYPVFANIFTREEGYSRKVFVGGLPPDIDEEEITTAFRRFGPLIVDWPHKTESKAYFPPKGYCFLLFQDERSVQSLINACIVDESKYYWCVSSPTMKDKPVQIRPWNLADSDFVMDGSQPLDPRKTIFVGGVPRPLRAIELALIMDRLYGGVCYAGIDTDPELKYPKGAGRVAFSNQQSYIAAISARFVQLQHNEIDKRVEVKPYVLDNQMCDECQGTRCGGKFAPFFCANVTCLQYYCEQCWVQIHSRYGREYHKPLVKEGAERPRPALYRW